MVKFDDVLSESSSVKDGFLTREHFSVNRIKKSHIDTLHKFMKGYIFFNIKEKKEPNLVMAAKLAKTTPGRLLRYLCDYIIIFVPGEYTPNKNENG